MPVTPCVGVWIEIVNSVSDVKRIAVTPCVGVWIEIQRYNGLRMKHSSLPAWECGLK